MTVLVKKLINKFFIFLIISALSTTSLVAQPQKKHKRQIDSLLQLAAATPSAERSAIYFELLKVKYSQSEHFEKVVKEVFQYAQLHRADSLSALAAQRSALRLINTGEHALARERLAIAERYYERFSHPGQQRMLVTTLVLTGYNLHRQNYVTEALKVYLRALPIAKVIHNQKQINNLYNRVINLYVAQKEYRKALLYANLIEKSCVDNANNSCPFYVTSQQAKANIYLDLNQIDSARQAIDTYFPLLPRRVKNVQLMSGYIGKGRLKMKERQWEVALQYIDSARVFALELNRPKAAASTYSQLANIYRSTGDLRNERTALQEQRAIAQLHHFPKMEMAALDRLRSIAVNQLDYETAYQYGEAWRTIRDSFEQIERVNIIKRHDELIAQYEQAEQMQLLANEQIRQRSWNNRLLFLLLFALLIIGFAIYFLRVRRRLNASLQQKNQLLNQAVKDRELLIKEVHHRVKNNLQIITSLLNLQLRHVTHPAARSALTDGRNRVRSISLLHQDLYQESTLKGVNSEVYLTNIINNLQYAFRDQQVEVQIQIDKIIVNEEKMVLVGLIINEALTNAYKHAFFNTKQPMIQLHFQKKDSSVYLSIQDNGSGFDSTIQTEQRQSFGLQLIEDMARKLKGDFSLSSTVNGTLLELSFSIAQP